MICLANKALNGQAPFYLKKSPIAPLGHYDPRVQVCWWFLGSAKVDTECTELPFFGTSFLFWFVRNTAKELKTFLLNKASCLSWFQSSPERPPGSYILLYFSLILFHLISLYLISISHVIMSFVLYFCNFLMSFYIIIFLIFEMGFVTLGYIL